jgi:hypothetical protein
LFLLPFLSLPSSHSSHFPFLGAVGAWSQWRAARPAVWRCRLGGVADRVGMGDGDWDGHVFLFLAETFSLGWYFHPRHKGVLGHKHSPYSLFVKRTWIKGSI